MEDKIKILIADDVETNRFTLRDIVQEMGYQPVLAENGEQALRIVRRFSIQLILLDVAMPVMDGYQFCQVIKDDPERRDIPIIFISAFDDPDDIVKGFEIGGEDYITKPFIREVVRARISSHLKMIEANKDMQDINQKLQTSLTNQMNQIANEKMNVLYAIIRLLKECWWYDESEMTRLSVNCGIFTEALQLSAQYGNRISDEFLKKIEVICILRDVGNISTPYELIIKKEEERTVQDNAIYKVHARSAIEILQDIQRNTECNDSIRIGIEIAGYHHERYDGKGYPEELVGDDIPLSAQIVSIVSDFNALSTKYEGDIEKTMDVIKSESGKKFNPVFVDVMSKIAKRLK